MNYQVVSADCHVDLCWLPPDLFTTNASAAMKDRMPHVEDGPAGALDSASTESSAAVNATDPGSVLEHDDHGHSHDHDHSHDHAHITEPADAAHADQPTPAG